MQLGNRFSQHSFAQIPDVHIGRSQFNRSHTIKDTFDFDYLVPIYLDEVIPGDTYNVTMASFARLATQVVPIMDNMYIEFFFFFVPNRIIYDKWEQLNGANIPNVNSTTDYILPQMVFGAGEPNVDTIFDKMGLPTDVADGWTLKNTLPFRAYNKIYNDWFRDQNLQNMVPENVDEGPDAPGDYVLLKRNKAHDYFTSCLPWPQKGDPVTIPIAQNAYVERVLGAPANKAYVANTNTPLTSVGVSVNASSNFSADGGVTELSIDPNGAWVVDLETAAATTINQLRQAFMMQSMLELDARGGTRYVEILRAHFGVISPDFRLQRAEFLGSGRININSHPVAQTSPTDGTQAQGQLAAFATAAASRSDNIGFTKSFVEHGYILGLACARADLTYQQGLNRMWNRSTRYDFFWPKLQQLGEQEVLNSEIYLSGTESQDNAAFGYQERYAEYRYRPSEIHGRFRSTYAQSLDYWHLAEEFGSLPVLNSAFIQQNTPIERAIAVDTEPDLLFDAYFMTKCARPMMTYSVPATLGRF